jgi:hypothetical protein
VESIGNGGPRKRGRPPGGGGYSPRIRQVVASLLEEEEAFGLQEVRRRDDYLLKTEVPLVGEPLPDDRTLSRVLWRFARAGKLRSISRGMGQGHRVLYVRGENWSDQ